MLKFYLRLYVTPLLVALGRMLRIDWTKLGQLFGRFVLITQVAELGKQVYPARAWEKRSQLNIVFLSMLGGFHTNNSIQMLLAMALRKKGHEISFVICDGVLPICEMTEEKTHDRRNIVCKQCFLFGNRFLRRSGFKVINASELYDDSNIIPSNRWDSFVESMLLRYFKIGSLNGNIDRVKKRKDDARRAASISENIGIGLAKLNPDRVIIGHGVYTTRGPAREKINEMGIPLISISRGKMAQTQKLNWKTSGDWWDVSTEWEKVKNVPLKAYQSKILDDYFESRKDHSRDVMVYNHSVEETAWSLIGKLGIEEERTIYTLFTNVLWDATSAQREIVFTGAIDWVIETINWFSNRPDVQLIIRVHPAEKVIGTNQPFQKILEKEIKSMPSNVKVLPPDIDVNSWSLLKITDVGLVHTSTVGLELAMKGKRCICVANTHYRSKGFTYDATNKIEYLELIEKLNIKTPINKKIKDLARRYAYLVFMRYQLPFPFFNPKTHININSFSDLNIDRIVEHPSVRTAVDGIENLKEFILKEEYVKELYKEIIDR